MGDAAHPSRVPEAGFDAGGARVLSTDRIAIAGLVLLDPAVALARAVPLALSRPALDRSGLTARLRGLRDRDYSQPCCSAVRTASRRLRAPVF